MRLLAGLVIAALTGVTLGASQEPAEVYILTADQVSSGQTSTPQIPRQVARDILFQRIGSEAPYSDLPDSIDEETSLSYILKYGGSPAPLFEEEQQHRIPHVLAILEGVTSKNAETLRTTLSVNNLKPAFTISDPPSARANRYLVDVELKAAGVSQSNNLESSLNPDERSVVMKYDAKDSASFAVFSQTFASLLKDVKRGDTEVTLVLMPESSRNSKLSHWTSSVPSQVQRRQSGESVLTEGDVEKPKAVATASDKEGSAFPWATTDPKATIPSCFQSYNSCVAATANCSSHGVCADKYAIPGQGSGETVCFHCACKSTYKYPEKGENSPTIHWGGNTCQKIDVSSPFWLITGLTIVLVGIVSMCIGMLFSVGEEKLPGVIGAGVSRSSK